MSNCFVILPKVEPQGYAQGHFNRVYDYVIVPACRLAGFFPTRIDNMGSTEPIDSIKALIDSEVAIFDLSTNHQDALYGLAVRKALNLPSVVIKDIKTFVSLGSDFSIVEYDDSLRIDTVQKETDAISEALKGAISNASGKHDVLIQLGVGVKPVSTTSSTAEESFSNPEPEEEKPKVHSLPIIDPLPDYVGEAINELDIETIKPGDILFHMNHGRGEIKTVRKVGNDRMAEVIFDSGNKILMLGASSYFRKVK